MPEEIYKIQNIKNMSLPSEDIDLEKLLADEEVQNAIKKAQELYLPWQEFRLKSWVPGNKEHVWYLVALQRRFSFTQTPIRDQSGNFYTFNPRSHVQFLHEVDLELGGNFIGVPDFSQGDRRQIIRRNLIEESIASSKLEGANTSREVARKMLKEGRKPRTKDEQMIVNNHKAMRIIEEELKNEPLSINILKDLHREVTKGTLRDANLEGSLRETFDENGNRLKIMPWDEKTVAYVTPDREFVEEELSKLIRFANDHDNNVFIHPLTKAIMLHFWVGLLHPFEDGNGRLARILFYWYMLKKGYWAFAYLSLSECIIKSPKQYAMAYIYSEQDHYDLNYFIHYNMTKLKLARQQFQKYLKEKISENKQAVKIIQSGYNFNLRQLKLLQYLAKDEQRYTTVKAYHADNSDIGNVTAISDLKKLITEGFLIKVRSGKNVYYYPTSKIQNIIQ
ncbi:Fic family protein [Rickettsiales bacterium]|nr:Fic family protein [Rickettsiales bacterium]